MEVKAFVNAPDKQDRQKAGVLDCTPAFLFQVLPGRRGLFSFSTLHFITGNYC
jgi:hypothetical protein